MVEGVTVVEEESSGGGAKGEWLRTARGVWEGGRRENWGEREAVVVMMVVMAVVDGGSGGGGDGIDGGVNGCD